jgi:membrane protein required for beta-lactamase induction
VLNVLVALVLASAAAWLVMVVPVALSLIRHDPAALPINLFWAAVLGLPIAAILTVALGFPLARLASRRGLQRFGGALLLGMMAGAVINIGLVTFAWVMGDEQVIGWWQGAAGYIHLAFAGGMAGMTYRFMQFKLRRTAHPGLS